VCDAELLVFCDRQLRRDQVVLVLYFVRQLGVLRDTVGRLFRRNCDSVRQGRPERLARIIHKAHSEDADSTADSRPSNRKSPEAYLGLPLYGVKRDALNILS
jgi:hypothetical protein